MAQRVPDGHVGVVANSQRAPYTLKAESAEEAREWAQAIEMHAPRILQMRGGAVKESTGLGQPPPEFWRTGVTCIQRDVSVVRP